MHVDVWVPALLLAWAALLLLPYDVLAYSRHGDGCTPLSPVLLDTLGRRDSPRSCGRVRSWGLVHLGHRAWGEEVEGQRCGARLLFPACPGEPPSPRGRSGSPTRGEEPVSAWPCYRSLVCIKPSLVSICAWDSAACCLSCLCWLPSGASASTRASSRGEGRGSGGPQNL